jgi:hypothetical protein
MNRHTHAFMAAAPYVGAISPTFTHYETTFA